MAFVIPDDELEIRATRSGGPGGQHVNTSATRVEVVWDVRSSPSLTEPRRARLLERLAARLDRRGRIRVVAAAHRSQRRNLTDAVERLQALVRDALAVPKPRKATRPPRAAAAQRVDAKRRRGARKRERRPPGTDD